MRSILLLLACLLAANISPAASESIYVPGQLLVRFLERPTLDQESGLYELDQAFAGILDIYPLGKATPLFHGLKGYADSGSNRVFKLGFEESVDMEMLADLFEGTGKVEYAEPDYLLPLTRTPNDPSLGQQYTMNRVDAPEAWDLIPANPSNPDMIIAIIDSGVDWNHPDLINRIWINPEEDLDGDGVMATGSTPGEANERNGIDEDPLDGNTTYVDDFYGWDWVVTTGCATGEDCTTPDNNPMDFNGHGTHCSGIAAAQTNNAIGIASIAWDARIMCLRAGFSDTQGDGYVITSAAVQAVEYAVFNEAKIISMSFGGGGGNTLKDAAQAAYFSGLLCFHAAGNDNSSLREPLDRAQGIISVAASEGNDCKASYSNYGSWIDVSAPGSGIYSTVFNNSYVAFDGTSMACPNAASCAALIWWMNPELTNAEVRERLVATVDIIDGLNCNSGYEGQLGSGRINAYKALMNIRETTVELGVVSIINNNGSGHYLAGDTLRVDYSLSNTGINDTEEMTLTLSCNDPGIALLTPTLTIPALPEGITYQGVNWPALFRIVDDTRRYVQVDLAISIPNADDLSATLEFMVGRPNILLYDDSPVEEGVYVTYYNAFKELGWIFDWYSGTGGNFPNLPGQTLDMNLYLWTLYASGTNTSTLDVTEQALFTEYASSNDLLFSSQHADESIAGTAFFSSVLEAQTGAGSSNSRGARGVADTPTNGMWLILQGGDGAGNQDLPISEVLPSGDGQVLFKDNASNFSIGLNNGQGPNRVVYLNFALEATGGSGSSVSLVAVLDSLVNVYLLDGVSVTDAPSLAPRGSRLAGAWPNPFNPSTTVSFDLDHQAQVRLDVFNVLGQAVAVLVDESLPAGNHLRLFDASALPSGLYLLRLELDGHPMDQQKLMLLR